MALDKATVAQLTAVLTERGQRERLRAFGKTPSLRSRWWRHDRGSAALGQAQTKAPNRMVRRTLIRLHKLEHWHQRSATIRSSPTTSADSTIEYLQY
jgi:hypothetical protein